MRYFLIALFVLSTTSVSQAFELLECEFKIFSAPFLTTLSELNDDRSIGLYSTARFSSGEGRQVPNKVHATKANELYSFELNEEEGGDNIHIYVYQDFTALAHNKADPYTGKQKGTCAIIER